MTDRTAFIAAICAAPDDDAPRLVYADWLEERGEAERAEFIRLQCELADPKRRRCAGATDDGGCDCLDKARERRVNELLMYWSEWYPDGPECLLVPTPSYFPDNFPSNRLIATSRRGFIDEIRGPAADWLARHAALAWHPDQTEECKNCGGWGVVADGWKDEEAGIIAEAVCIYCKDGRVPRPCPETAQPLRVVRLTDDGLAVSVRGRGQKRIWNFENDPSGWQSEPDDWQPTLLPTRREQINAVLSHVCQLRWPWLTVELPADGLELQARRLNVQVEMSDELLRAAAQPIAWQLFRRDRGAPILSDHRQGIVRIDTD